MVHPGRSVSGWRCAAPQKLVFSQAGVATCGESLATAAAIANDPPPVASIGASVRRRKSRSAERDGAKITVAFGTRRRSSLRRAVRTCSASLTSASCKAVIAKPAPRKEVNVLPPSRTSTRVGGGLKRPMATASARGCMA